MQNDLEKTILRSAKKAQRDYEAMTGGQWLDHAPEMFLQAEVARGIWRRGFRVFIDASLDRIRQEIGSRKGRNPAASRKRFDISVWWRTRNSIRAVIEIKRDWSITSIREDARKIKDSFKLVDSADTGYLLVYSEANREPTIKKGSADWEANRERLLRKRFVDWARKLRWNSVGVVTGSYKTDHWGLALLRLDNRRKRT